MFSKLKTIMIMLFFLSLCFFNIAFAKDTQGTDILLFNSDTCKDGVCAVWKKGFEAIENFIKGNGYTFEHITGEQLRGNYDLTQHKAIWIPGGWAGYQYDDLTNKGTTYKAMDKIREFVGVHGKAYIGTCAGAYLAASEAYYNYGGPYYYRLNLFNGKSIGPQYPPDSSHPRMEKVNLTGWPVKIQRSWFMSLRWGPYFEKIDDKPDPYNLKIIGTWEDGHNALIYFEYGGNNPAGKKGKVLLMGPHLEVTDNEANSAGPGSTEWDLLDSYINQLLS